MTEANNSIDIKKYIIDYSELYNQNKLVTLVGREDENSRLIQTLIRTTKNSPILIGDSGIGKNAIVEGIAKTLASPHEYPAIKDKKLYSINISLMLTDAKDEEDYLNLFKTTVDYLINTKTAILYINDISILVKMKGYEENSSIANFMKVKFTQGEIQCIITSDIANFKQYIEPDLQIMGQLQILQIEEPNIRESFDVIKGSKEVYEKHYNLIISEDVLKAVVNLGYRYVKNRRFPDKAFDILDDACALVQMQNKPELTIDDICDVVSSWTGIPLEKLDAEDKDRLVRMEELLRSRVKGQEEAVTVVSDAMRRAKSGLQDPNRPIASFLFIGTTGVGKTELAKALAEFIFSDETALLRLDMSEFMERANITRLLGPPPGTPGYEQGGMLTESVRLHPYQVVLFDELEKAHPDVLNILLQLLDEGRLTDSRGVTVDFRNTIVIMTSNIGSNVPRYQRMEVLSKSLRAEFLNRIDDIVTFGQLGAEDLLGVVGIQLKKLLNRANEQKINLEFSKRLREWLVAEVYASKYGVRALKRLIQHEVENKLAWLFLNNKIVAGDNPIADMDAEEQNVIITLNGKELPIEMPSMEEEEKKASQHGETEEEKASQTTEQLPQDQTPAQDETEIKTETETETKAQQTIEQLPQEQTPIQNESMKEAGSDADYIPQPAGKEMEQMAPPVPNPPIPHAPDIPHTKAPAKPTISNIKTPTPAPPPPKE